MWNSPVEHEARQRGRPEEPTRGWPAQRDQELARPQLLERTVRAACAATREGLQRTLRASSFVWLAGLWLSSATYSARGLTSFFFAAAATAGAEPSLDAIHRDYYLFAHAA